MAAHLPFPYLEEQHLAGIALDSSEDFEEEIEKRKRCPPQNLELFLTGLALKYNVEKEDISNNIITRFFESRPPNHIWYHYEARNIIFINFFTPFFENIEIIFLKFFYL